jgi:hypothetical protein
MYIVSPNAPKNWAAHSALMEGEKAIIVERNWE